MDVLVENAIPDMDDRPRIRLRVLEMRKALGLTQEALAERSGVRRATIVAIEKGQTTGVDFDVLTKLADALGVNSALLVDDDGPQR